MVCTISGTTITAGTDTMLASGAINASDMIFALALDSVYVFVTHSYDSNKYLYGMICTVSGTSISVGIDTIINNSTINAGRVISAIVFDNGRVLIAHSYDSSNCLYGILATFAEVIGSYADTINGIAKTAGAAGEIVSVYVPE